MNTFSTPSSKEVKIINNTADAAVKAIVFGNYQKYCTVQDIEDMVGETVCRALNGYRTFDSAKSSLATWVGAIARNAVYDMIKYIMLRRGINCDMYPVIKGQQGDADNIDLAEMEICYDTEMDDWDPQSRLEHKEMLETLDNTRKSFNKRDALIDRYSEEGYKAGEIAAILGTSANVVSVRKFHIKEKYQEALRIYAA